MRIRLLTPCILLLFLVISGCAFISIPLSTRTMPLEEKTLEGSGKNKILLISISGVISSDKKRSLTDFDMESDMVSRVKEELTKAGEDERIRAIVLKINSPGGTVTASDIIYREIRKFKEKNQVYVIGSMMDLATSGAYYIANAADAIIAHPTTVTGSIGVIAMKFNLQGLMGKIGVEEDSIKAGRMKDILSPFRPMSTEERRIIQDLIDSMHLQFMQAVASGRKSLSLAEIKPLADGRVFTAQQALDAKLVDGIGYLDEAIDAAKKAAGLEEAKVITYYRPASYKNNIYSQTNFSVFNFAENDILSSLPVRFMYLWNP